MIRTTGLIETNKRYDADNRLIRIKNEHRFTGDLIDEYSYRYDSNNNIIEEIKREPYRKKVSLLDIEKTEENDHTIRVTKQTFTYDAENKLTDARVERLGMKALSEPNVTTYHYEYDPNGNRTTVEIKDDGLTLESTVYTYDRLNKLVSSREVTASGLYLYEYTYDDNGNLISEDRHRQFETQRTNIRRYEYTKDNKLESVYSGNTLLVSYTYDGDGTITSSLERDLDLNQNLNIHDHNYINSLTNNQRQLINKVPTNDSFLYELTEYITDKNRPYSETLMERDGTGQLSTIYTYGNQRINSESYNNLSGLYTYDGRGSVSAVIGSYGDFRASYWYDSLGNVKSQIHGYGAFGSGKKYYGYNAEQYNPVTGNQNLRNRQVNIRRQRFLTEDTYLGKKNSPITLNRYIYGNDNPLKHKDPDGLWAVDVQVGADVSAINGGGGSIGFVVGENSYEGVFGKMIGSAYIAQSGSMGINGSISIGIDVTDNQVGNSFQTQVSSTVFYLFGLPVDVGLTFNNNKIVGINASISAGLTKKMIPIVPNIKEQWIFSEVQENMNYSKVWYDNGIRITNPSEISLKDKQNLSERERNILDNLINDAKVYNYSIGCK